MSKESESRLRKAAAALVYYYDAGPDLRADGWEIVILKRMIKDIENIINIYDRRVKNDRIK